MTIALVLGAAADYPAAAALRAGARERDLEISVIAAGLPSGEDADLVSPIDVQVLLGAGSPATREGLALMGVEREILPLEPSAMVVFTANEVGLAAALVAAKQRIPLWWAGAGRWAFEARDGDDIGSPPPEEDLVASLAEGMLAPTEFAATSLAAARHDVKRIWVTGPLEAETLERHRPAIGERSAAAGRGLRPFGYVVASVDDEDLLPGQPLPIENVRGLPYVDRVSLAAEASVVVTDGFDLQMEACLLRVPCLVLAPASPLRETRAAGAAKRCPADPASIALAIAEQASRTERDWAPPPMFDADVSARILGLIAPAPPPEPLTAGDSTEV